MSDLFLAVGRSYRFRTNHENEIGGGLDVGENFLLPLCGQWNVFPVHPGLALLRGECVAQFVHEVFVFAGIRDEDLCHDDRSPEVAQVEVPPVTASSASRTLAEGEN
jgi:hypothetical protein